MSRTPLTATPLLLLAALTALALFAPPRAVHGADTFAAPSVDDPVDPFGFHESEYSSWGIVDAPYPYDPAAAPPAGSGRPNGQGCFPVGNGVVFATLGLDGDFNTLTNITGPGYQTRDENSEPVYWQAGDWPDQGIALYKFSLVEKPDEQGQLADYWVSTAVVWETQSIQTIRKAAMVRTRLKGPVGVLYCLTYAVPSAHSIIRDFILEPAEQEGQKCYYALLPSLPPDWNLNQGYDPMTVRFWKYIQVGDHLLPERLDVTAFFTEFRRGLPLFRSSERAGSQWRCGIAYTVEETVESAPRLLWDTYQDRIFTDHPTTENLNDYQLRTTDYWREWSSHNLKFDTGDARLDDLMTQLPVIIETQRDAASGGVAPMVSYHGYWVRDSLGPLYMYLLNGRFEEVERMLRYHRQACWKLGACSMLVPLDVDVSEVKEPMGLIPGGAGVPAGQRSAGAEARPTGSGGVPPPVEDGRRDAAPTGESWDAIPVEHAEVPSLIVLQHYWLWQALRSAGRGAEADAFIAEAWPFLTHNLFAMPFDPRYGVKFHGDETYTNGALYSTFDNGLPDQLGWPNGYIPTDFFSFDNTLMHYLASGATAMMAQALKLDDDASRAQHLMQQVDPTPYFPVNMPLSVAFSPQTQQAWRTPFAHQSLSPFWLGAGSTRFPYSKVYDQVLQQLWREPYPMSTPWSGYMTGHSLAYWLFAATQQGDRKTAEAAVRMLINSATPEGGWCEVLDPQGNPVNVYGRVNRIRPWESGINYAALAQYLQKKNGWLIQDREEHGRTTPAAPPEPPVQAYPYPFTQLLVLTTDNHYKDTLKLDRRLSSIPADRITVWDAGLPFSAAELRAALLSKPHDVGELGFPGVATAKPELPPVGIPYLYLDRGVQLADRRTFKTQAFWDAVQPVLDDYKAAGGQIIDENSLDIALADDEVVALKTLLVLYPRTFTWEMDDATIAKFHQEIARWIGWCDKVGGDKFRIDIDILQIDRRLPPLSCGPQGGNVYWMGFSDVEADLAARAVPRDYYDSVCCFWAWDREAPSLPGGEKAAQAYGGAAQGPGTDVALLGAPGRTSYYGAAVLKSHFVTTGRVALHEYIHNMDAMFEMAGMQDQFYSSDDMEAHMPELLKARPGAFEALGYDDAAMLDLAEKSARGEAGFPWRTQLVYYEWQIERTPRADFAQLLRRYGTREKRAPRERLYSSFILPEGAQAYQVEFPGQASDAGGSVRDINTDTGADGSVRDEWRTQRSAPLEPADTAVRPTGNESGLAPITIEDVDPDDGFVHWRSAALGGFLADGDLGAPLRRYREAEIVAPDYREIVLGQDEPRISASLRITSSGAALQDAQVSADAAGQTIVLAAADAGGYSAALPGGLETETRITLRASAPDYVISDNPVTFKLRPAWTAIVQFRSNPAGGPPISSPFDPGIYVSIDGPPGEYKAQLSYKPDYNTVLQKLADDGLLPRSAVLDTTLTLAAGGESYIECERHDWEARQYESGTLRVDYTASGGSQSSFTEQLPPRLPRTTLLAGIDTAKLPDYIPRAILMSPTIDGDLSDWPAAPRVDGELGEIPAWPSLNLSLETGHAFNGTFSGDADCSSQLWFAYDLDNLYVAGHVTDDFIKRGDMWTGDRLNLVFDARCDSTRTTYPHGAVGHTGWEADDWWVLLCPFMSSGDGQPLTERLGGEIPSGGKTGYFGPVLGAKQAVVEEPGGYRFEWALPLSQLPYLTAESGTFTGFSVFLTDHDAAGMAELMYLTDWGTPSGIEWRYWDCGLLYFAP